MKISGGDWRGRPLKVPAGDAVRPTQDRVREALFSMLQFELADAAFLDLFAGSGSVGLEALSRGAACATFVEVAPRHVTCLPPYALGAEQGYAKVLAVLAERNIVKPDGLFIAEMKAHQTPDESPLWELVRDRTYGQTRIAIYRRLSPEM